jgi:hypothetical protein
VTSAQKDALEWLRKRGGDGSRQRGNVLLAAGEIAPVMWSTWKKLAELGKVEIYGAGKFTRVRVL